MATSRIDENGDWNFGQSQANYLTESKEVSQNIITALRFFKGEWFLDTEKGIDWVKIFQKPNNETEIKNTVISTVSSVEGVEKVDKVEIKSQDDRTATIEVFYKDIYEVQLKNLEVNI